MTDPLRRLKFLPWLSLLQVSALITLILVVLDLLLILGSAQSVGIKRALTLLYSPPLGLVVTFAVAVGIGALAVYLLEILYRKGTINSGILWALVLCLALGLVLRSVLPVPPFLVDLNEIQLVCMIVGVFWKGRPYWR